MTIARAASEQEHEGSTTMKKPEVVLNEDGSREYAASTVGDACAKIWSQVAAQSRKSVIVYVHGRAAGFGGDREPQESFVKDKVIAEFETDHNAAVVMLHWPHSAFLLGFPEVDARAAGPLLAKLLRNIEGKRPATMVGIPVVVVTHSMGGIVLEEAVLGDFAAFDAVNNVVTSASAAKLKSSHQWLGRIKPKVYVTRNEHDSTLNSVKSHGPFIGLGKAQTLVTSGLADGVFYLDVTNQEVSHPYFYARQSVDDGRAHLRDKFFGPLYAGKALKMANFDLAVPGSTVYMMK